MSRRPHKKSKNGCFECKKRHIRCDEHRPVCVNCHAAEIRCSFLGTGTLHLVPDPGVHSDTQYNSPNISTTPSTPAPTTLTSHVDSDQDKVDPYSLNITHLELFHNLSSEDFLTFEHPEHPRIITHNVISKYMLSTPYLMHQVLSISALHLSIKHSTSCGFYRDYATGLQNRALVLFKTCHPVLEVTPSNCAPIFIFSSFVGIHLLCDTLHYQRHNFEWFVDHFTHYLNISHGVLTVVHQCWDLLHETELGPGLKITATMMHPKDTKGSECAPLWDLIEVSPLNDSSRNAYQESISKLQQVFDALQGLPGVVSGRPLLTAWPVMVPTEYVDLLRQRRPEAVIILAYYAVLLHRGRDSWLYGDGGRFLLETICSYLGPEWHQWLALPKAVLSTDESNQEVNGFAHT